MKKLSLKDFSILGLVLMGASALTAAMIPSKADTNDANGPAGDGKALISSVSLGETVTFTASGGVRSWTQTGPAGNAVDGISATSANVFAQTNTNQLGVGNQTADGTTALANE